MTTVGSEPRDAADDTQTSPLLSVRDLGIRFRGADRDVYAVSGIDFDVHRGEIFAIVGESGSGKSVTALSVMGLVPSPPAEITGSIRLEGRELIGLSNKSMRAIRGRHVGMVFQDPMSSLNPVHPVGRQIGEGIRLHMDTSRKHARRLAIELLGQVGIPDPARRVDDYPHEFSGGMRQRAMIAMALACDPKLLIADEPTTALDVTVQNQIVELVRRLQADRGMAVIWITHDLGVVAEIADRVAVMYGGRIMETSTAAQVYGRARHPYTSGLLRSIPRLDQPISVRLAEIPGTPRTVISQPTGCVFHHRCPMGGADCSAVLPELQQVGEDHLTACIHHDQITGAGEMWIEAALRTSVIPGRSPHRRSGEEIVRVEDLAVHFPGRRAKANPVRAVDGVDLTLERGRTLGVVGESGCGKTTLGRALVG
ncbi:MAG: oligopeptide/dipeptide ABC transporter ATP-binding protein, partial [Acidimicrobiia bacterium]